MKLIFGLTIFNPPFHKSPNELSAEWLNASPLRKGPKRTVCHTSAAGDSLCKGYTMSRQAILNFKSTGFKSFPLFMLTYFPSTSLALVLGRWSNPTAFQPSQELPFSIHGFVESVLVDARGSEFAVLCCIWGDNLAFRSRSPRFSSGLENRCYLLSANRLSLPTWFSRLFCSKLTF